MLAEMRQLIKADERDLRALPVEHGGIVFKVRDFQA